MAGKRYDTEELQRIAALRDRGLSIQAVAREVGRTPSGIQSALRARGWIDPERSKLMSAVSIFSAEQRDAFGEFVVSRAAQCTPTDIRNAWNKEAAARQWPIVNNERVLYYLHASGLKKTKGEYMRSEGYRTRQSAAQKTRRAKEQAACLRSLRAQRTEIYASEPTVPRRQCHLCRETWPLSAEFFRYSGRSRKYFLKTCRICYHNVGGTAEERRTLRLHAYDRHVAVKQISLAKAERDAFLQKHRNFPTRSCSRCHETWELLPHRFPKYRLASGRDRYRKTCRFCLRADARLKERAKVEMDRLQTAMSPPEMSAPGIVEQGNPVFSFHEWNLPRETPVIAGPDGR